MIWKEIFFTNTLFLTTQTCYFELLLFSCFFVSLYHKYTLHHITTAAVTILWGQTESKSGNVSASDRPVLFFVHVKKKKRVYWNVRHLLWNGTKCPWWKHKGNDTKSSILFFKCFSFQAKTDQHCILSFSLTLLYVYIHRHSALLLATGQQFSIIQQHSGL